MQIKSCIYFFLSDPYDRFNLIPYKKNLFFSDRFPLYMIFFQGTFLIFCMPFSVSEFADFENIYMSTYKKKKVPSRMQVFLFTCFPTLILFPDRGFLHAFVLIHVDQVHENDGGVHVGVYGGDVIK